MVNMHEKTPFVLYSKLECIITLRAFHPQEHRDFLVSTVPALYTELASFFSAHLAFRDAVNAATDLQQTAQSLAGQGMLLELQLGGAQAATQKAESSLAGSLQQMEALRAGVEAAAKESRQWWDQHETAVQGLKGSGPAKEQVRGRAALCLAFMNVISSAFREFEEVQRVCFSLFVALLESIEVVRTWACLYSARGQQD